MKIKNPKIKINSEVDLISMIVLDNNSVVVYPTISGLFETVALRDPWEVFSAHIFSNDPLEVEDLVNCTFDLEVEGVIITDPTKDASCVIKSGSPT